MKFNNAKGFTLVELMIVVAIVGILAAVAVPAYQNSIIKGNRAAAQSFMMDVASRQKQYLLDAREYAPTVAALQMTAPPEVTKNYTITICLDFANAAAACPTPSSPPYFRITAEPIPGKPQAVGKLILDDVGAKTITIGTDTTTW